MGLSSKQPRSVLRPKPPFSDPDGGVRVEVEVRPGA